VVSGRISPRRLSHPARAGFVFGLGTKKKIPFKVFAQPPSPPARLPEDKKEENGGKGERREGARETRGRIRDRLWCAQVTRVRAATSR